MNLQLVHPHLGALGGLVIDEADVPGGADKVKVLLATRKVIRTTAPRSPGIVNVIEKDGDLEVITDDAESTKTPTAE